VGRPKIDAEPYVDLPVWVDLDALYGPAPADVEPRPGGWLRDALVLTGTVPGLLRQWGCAVDGRRIGLVDDTVRDISGATTVRHTSASCPNRRYAPERSNPAGRPRRPPRAGQTAPL
jgi:hypothetical protein